LAVFAGVAGLSIFKSDSLAIGFSGGLITSRRDAHDSAGFNNQEFSGILAFWKAKGAESRTRSAARV
jgi:hypothetical protein